VGQRREGDQERRRKKRKKRTKRTKRKRKKRTKRKKRKKRKKKMSWGREKEREDRSSVEGRRKSQ